MSVTSPVSSFYWRAQSWLRRVPRRSDGFTLVELMVALVILGIVVAAISRPLIGAFSTASQARSSEGAQASVLRAADTLQGDVLTARSPDRNTSRQRGVDSLTSALLKVSRGNAVSDDPSDAGRTYDVYDVLVATRTKLQLVGEMNAANLGTECAQWDVADTSATGQVSVRRRLFGTRTCGGAVLDDEMIVPDQRWVPTNIGETQASVRPRHWCRRC